MTRHLFPGDLFLVEGVSNATLLGAGVTFSVWTARAGGTDVTSSCLADDNTSSLIAIADPDGKRPYFYGPDGTTTLYIDAGIGERYPVYAVDSIGGAVPQATGSQTGIWLNDATSKPAITIGNAPGSAGFPGTGTPPKALGALAIYQKFGDESGGTATPIINTTQAAYVLASYYGPTTDDSMEGLSVFCAAKDTITNYTQAKPITALEGIAQVEAGNTANSSAPVRAVASRVIAAGVGSSIHTAESFYMSVNSSGGPPYGTITNYYGLHQTVASGATNAYGVYVVDPINSETGIAVARSAGADFRVKSGGQGDGSNSLAIVSPVVISYGTLSGTYTLTTTPQTLTTNSGATLPAGGGSFMLDSTARTIVTYTSFSGTTVSGVAIASGSVATTNGQAILDATTPNITPLRVIAHAGTSKNTQEWWDGIGNLRARVNPSGNILTQGTDFFAGNGSGTSLARISGSAGYVQPGTTAGVGGKIYSGSGNPSVISGSAAGDYYFRTDTPGTASQRIYVATAPNTWTALI